MSIEPRLEYDQKTSKVYGYCGIKGDEHKCQDFYTTEVIVIIHYPLSFSFDSDFSYGKFYVQVSEL